MGALFWFCLGGIAGGLVATVILCSFFVAARADEQAGREADHV